MLLATDLQGLGNLEGNEGVVGVATGQARLADDCQGGTLMPPLQCLLETTPLEICTAHVHQVCVHVWQHTFSCGLWPLMCVPAVMPGLGLPTQVKPVCGHLS